MPNEVKLNSSAVVYLESLRQLNPLGSQATCQISHAGTKEMLKVHIFMLMLANFGEKDISHILIYGWRGFA